MLFYELPMVNLSEKDIIEKARVRELVEYERYCRDYSDYGTDHAERRLWFDDARVITTQGDKSIDEFIPKERRAKYPDADGVIDATHHRVNNTAVWLNGDRAIAELLCTLISRTKVGWEWMDISIMCRMHYRAEKRGGQWGLVFMDVIYEQDRMDPIFQDCTMKVPRTAQQKHRNITWSQRVKRDLTGNHGRDEDLLYGYDRPEEVNKLYEESSKWLGVY